MGCRGCCGERVQPRAPSPGSFPSTEYGMYQPHCGLENVLMSWGHDGKHRQRGSRPAPPPRGGAAHHPAGLHPTSGPLCGRGPGLQPSAWGGGGCSSRDACSAQGVPVLTPPFPPEYMYRVMKFNNFALPKEVRAAGGGMWGRPPRAAGRGSPPGTGLSPPPGVLHGSLPLLLPLARARRLPAPLLRGGPAHAALGQGAQVGALGGGSIRGSGELEGSAEPPETDPASPPQQVRPLHQAGGAARRAAAPQLLPGAGRQVLPGAAVLVRGPAGTPPPRQDPPLLRCSPLALGGCTINLLVTHHPSVGSSPSPTLGEGRGARRPQCKGRTPPGPESSGAGMSKALFRKL